MTTPRDAALHLLKRAGIAPERGGMPFNDTGNAERLVEAHAEDLRFNPEWRKWLVYDGTRWEANASGEIQRRAKSTIDLMHTYASRLSAEAAAHDDEVLKAQKAKESQAFSKWALRSGGKRDLDAMIALASSDLSVEIKTADLNRSPWLLNVLNGTLDLRTGQLREHERKDLITKMAGCEYDPDAECPNWLKFLDRVMAGDQDVIDFLRRAIGYSLTGIVTEHVMFIMWGSGRNGKSTFINTIMALMGEYAQKAAPELLLTKAQDNHPTGSSNLYGARFAPTIETAEGRRLNETQVKELTGGDTVSTRRMRENYWEFAPVHHLWMATNHRPTISGTDLGIWSRIRMIPFTVMIPPKERDQNLQNKLLAELPGILAWAVRGCLEWQEGGLQAPTAVQEATKIYQTDMDILGDFIAERCVIAEGERVAATELYNAYKAWIPETGERVMTKKQLGQRLQERGFVSVKGAQGRRYWVGLRLAQDDDEDRPTQPGLFDQEFSSEIGGVRNSENPEIVPENENRWRDFKNPHITRHATHSLGVDGENPEVTPPQAQNENLTPPNAPPDDDEPEIVDLEDFDI